MRKAVGVLAERPFIPHKKVNVGRAIGCCLMLLSIIISLTAIYFVLSLVLKQGL